MVLLLDQIRRVVLFSFKGREARIKKVTEKQIQAVATHISAAAPPSPPRRRHRRAEVVVAGTGARILHFLWPLRHSMEDEKPTRMDISMLDVISEAIWMLP